MVTLSDMLLLLLTFFVLLISMSSFDHGLLLDVFGGPLPGSSGVLERGGSIPIVVAPNESADKLRKREDLPLDRRLSESRSRLLDNLEKNMGQALLRIELVDNGLELEIMSDKLFGTLDDALKPQGEEILRHLGVFLKDWRGLVEVEVHTDNFPMQTARFPDSSTLAAWRGAQLLDVLERYGLERKKILLAAYGADRGVTVNDTPENRQRNRRIVLRLPGWVQKIDAES
ncbi:MAG: OmpA family protein [Deltaproteobacteria bacterium]|nr:OmpA family protein [Deltaproteobacteria bacterium]